MAPLPGNLGSLPDGNLDTMPNGPFPDATELFEDGPFFGNENSPNIVDSFYELVQLRPNIVDELIEWKFLYEEWELAHEAEDLDELDYPDFAVLSVNETYGEWVRRCTASLVASPTKNPSGCSDALLEYPMSTEYDGHLYTEFMTITKYTVLLLMRDDNGVIRAFIYNPM
jgi:hypothetical protein